MLHMCLCSWIGDDLWLVKHPCSNVNFETNFLLVDHCIPRHKIWIIVLSPHYLLNFGSEYRMILGGDIFNRRRRLQNLRWERNLGVWRCVTVRVIPMCYLVDGRCLQGRILCIQEMFVCMSWSRQMTLCWKSPSSRKNWLVDLVSLHLDLIL